MVQNVLLCCAVWEKSGYVTAQSFRGWNQTHCSAERSLISVSLFCSLLKWPQGTCGLSWGYCWLSPALPGGPISQLFLYCEVSVQRWGEVPELCHWLQPVVFSLNWCSCSVIRGISKLNGVIASEGRIWFSLPVLTFIALFGQAKWRKKDGRLNFKVS